MAIFCRMMHCGFGSSNRFVFVHKKKKNLTNNDPNRTCQANLGPCIDPL